MNALALLETRKNVPLFAGLLITFAASLPLAIAGASNYGLPGREMLTATLLFWCVAGIPGGAVLLAAGAGAGLRAGGDAERLLPVSPGLRLGAALAAAGILAAAFAALAVSTTMFLVPDWASWLLQYTTYGWDRMPFLMPALLLAFFFSIYALPAAVGWAFATGSAALGILGGAATTIGVTWLLGLGIYRQLLVPDRTMFLSPMLLGAAVALLGIGAALRQLTPWLELRRRFHWSRALAVAAGILAGFAGAWAAHSHTYRVESAGLRTLEEDGHKDGALMRTLSGGLVWVRADGSRQVALPDQDIPTELYDPFSDLETDASGESWIIRRGVPNDAHLWEVWRGRPGQAMSMHTRFFEPAGRVDLAVREGKGVLEISRYWGDRFQKRRAPMPPVNGPPKFATVPDDPYQYERGVSQDGARWNRDNFGRYVITDAAGVPLPPIDLDQLIEPKDASRDFRLRLARVDGGILWVAAGFMEGAHDWKLFKVDSNTRKVIQSWPFPDRTGIIGWSASQPVAIGDGILILTARELWLMDWAGRTRRLGKA